MLIIDSNVAGLLVNCTAEYGYRYAHWQSMNERFTCWLHITHGVNYSRVRVKDATRTCVDERQPTPYAATTFQTDAIDRRC